MLVFLLLLGLLSAEDKKLSSSLEAGLLINTGNTSSQTYTFRGITAYESNVWKHVFGIEKIYSTVSGTESINKLSLQEKTDYKFSLLDYLFENIKYSKDRFNGYDYELTLALGYGRSIIKNDIFTLDAQIAPAYYHATLNDSTYLDKLTGLFSLNLKYTINKIAILSEDFNLMFGDTDLGIITESITTLTVNLMDNLAMKNTFTLKHKTQVPLGTEGLDTITAITILFTF